MSRFTIHDLQPPSMPARRRGRCVLYPQAAGQGPGLLAPRNSARKRSETVIAAIENNRDHLIAESADLVFHLLVLLKSRGISFADVEDALAQRTQMSGLEEKAARQARLIQFSADAGTRGCPGRREWLMDVRADQVQYNPYRVFSRAQWAALRDDMPMTLTAEEVARDAFDA